MAVLTNKAYQLSVNDKGETVQSRLSDVGKELTAFPVFTRKGPHQNHTLTLESVLRSPTGRDRKDRTPGQRYRKVRGRKITVTFRIEVRDGVYKLKEDDYKKVTIKKPGERAANITVEKDQLDYFRHVLIEAIKAEGFTQKGLSPDAFEDVVLTDEELKALSTGVDKKLFRFMHADHHPLDTINGILTVEGSEYKWEESIADVRREHVSEMLKRGHIPCFRVVDLEKLPEKGESDTKGEKMRAEEAKLVEAVKDGAREMLTGAEAFLKQNGKKLGEDERLGLEHGISQVKTALDGDDLEVLKASIEHLDAKGATASESLKKAKKEDPKTEPKPDDEKKPPPK